MALVTGSMNTALRISTGLLSLVGFLSSLSGKSNSNKIIVEAYMIFCFVFIAGISIITQTGDLIQVCGNVPLMTEAAFLLFTNIALATKIINVITRRADIKAMIKENEFELILENRDEGRNIINRCNSETTRQLILYSCLSGITVFGWAVSAEKGKLPLRAWYPYDANKYPAYELTYFYQIAAVTIGAAVNVSLDTLVTSLIAVCRCRLKLLAQSLKTLCEGLDESSKDMIRQLLLTQEQDGIVKKRLRNCILKHQSALRTASQIQVCFSEPILMQFFVSSVIICVTAYQLAVEVRQGNLMRIVSMLAYLLCMMLQVFLYCYQGNELVVQSSNISDAAYECPWYVCSLNVRKSLLLIMQRSHKVAQLTAGGFTDLSLACFASIIKASYTYFTVLQRNEDRR